MTMTREEKLYEAAEKFSDDYKYNEDVDYMSIMVAFREGAEWADNHPKNVWHDANEEPKDNIDEYGCGEDCLIIPKFGYAEIGQVLFDNGEYAFSCEMCVYSMDEIKCWAYLKNLLPK